MLLTEEYQPLLFAHDYPVQTIRMYSGSTFDWFVKSVWTLLTGWHDRAFAKRAMTIIKRENLSFDIVLCTTFNDFPLTAAQRIADTLGLPLVCDIRDLDEQVDDSRYQYKHQSRWLMPFRRIYRAVHIRRRNSVLRAADAITSVSPWHAEFIKQFNPNVHVVYNGYDDKQFYPENIPVGRFTVTYIGSLFAWQQPALEKVKQAVDALNAQHPTCNIIVDLHTPAVNPVPYDALGDTIRHSGIMLVLTNEHTHGMLTTKFYEALGCEKPILCVPSDNGSLAELIEYTHAGLATNDMEQIKAFIRTQYNEWQLNGFTRQATQHREEFSREAQCRLMETVL